MQTKLSYQINGAILTTFIVISAFFISLQLPFHEDAFRQYKRQIRTILETLVERDREPLANEIFEERRRAIRIRLQQMRQVKGILAIDVYNYAGQALLAEGPKGYFPVSLDLEKFPKKQIVCPGRLCPVFWPDDWNNRGAAAKEAQIITISLRSDAVVSEAFIQSLVHDVPLSWAIIP